MPSPCELCTRISDLHRQYRRKRALKRIRTWCRKCGGSAVIELGQLPYREAVKRLFVLDDTPFEHEGAFHTELGGWGIRWRFDEILRVAFPRESAIDRALPYWPLPAGYPCHAEAERRVVMLVGASDDGEEAPTVGFRRELARRINAEPRERPELQAEYGRVWNTDELAAEFEIYAFRTPFALVRRKGDGATGSLLFQNNPRYYFDFRTNRPSL